MICDNCGQYTSWRYPRCPHCNCVQPVSKKKPQYTKEDHLGCPSYPNCDLEPMGCVLQTKPQDLEWYGHR